MKNHLKGHVQLLRTLIAKDSISLICVSAGLWGLVNNAGILYFSPIEWTPLDIFRHTADVNLWGMIDVTKTFLPLIKKTRGRVVNLSSLAGTYTQAIPPIQMHFRLIILILRTFLGFGSNNCLIDKPKYENMHKRSYIRNLVNDTRLQKYHYIVNQGKPCGT